MMAFSARPLDSIPSTSVIFDVSFSASRIRVNVAFGHPHRLDSRASFLSIGPSSSYIRQSNVI